MTSEMINGRGRQDVSGSHKRHGKTTMAKSKTRKEDTENRTFKTDWTDTDMVIFQAASMKPVHLISLEQFGRTESATFWLQMVSETAFPNLRKVALYILTMFGSTYSCKAAFSSKNIQ